MKWIDINEDLPVIGEYCLVYMKRKGFSPTNNAIAQFTKYGFETASVTHWMLRPKPPTKQGI